MNMIRIGTAAAATMALVACNSTSDPAATTGGSSTGGGTPAPSTIFNTNSPFEGELATVIGVSPTAAQTILDFEGRNLLDVETSPSGGTVYQGRTAMELGDPGSSRLLEGEVVLFVDFASGGVNGQLQDLTLNDLQGNSETVDVIVIESTTIDQGRFTTTLSTDPFRVAGGSADERTATANVSTEGAFVSGGAEALGTFDGTVAIGSDPSEPLNGVFTADSN